MPPAQQSRTLPSSINLTQWTHLQVPCPLTSSLVSLKGGTRERQRNGKAGAAFPSSHLPGLQWLSCTCYPRSQLLLSQKLSYIPLQVPGSAPFFLPFGPKGMKASWCSLHPPPQGKSIMPSRCHIPLSTAVNSPLANSPSDFTLRCHLSRARTMTDKMKKTELIYPRILLLESAGHTAQVIIPLQFPPKSGKGKSRPPTLP